MSVSRPIAEFRTVSKSYDGRADVVRDLSLEMVRGEFLTLLGPSGAGKTTCLMMLAGHVRPSAGEILLRGQLATRTPAARRGIGMVGQADDLLAHKTVVENVALALGPERLSRADRALRLGQALEMVRLDGLADRLPAQLSAGQRRRVGLARALLHTPDLLLMDEPMGGLDPALRAELLDTLRVLCRRHGISVLYVTHDQMEALAVSTRIGVIHRGALRQIDTPERIYEHPANGFVAGFVGENNCLPGRVRAIEDDMAKIRLQAGPIVEARLAAPLRPGDACLLSVRPERVALAAMAARDLGVDALDAVVLDIGYQGDHYRIRLALGGEAEIIVRRPATAGLAGLVVDRPAAVAWQGPHAWAFFPE